MRNLATKEERKLAHKDFLLRKANERIKSQQEFIQELIRDKQFLQIKIDKLCKQQNKK